MHECEISFVLRVVLPHKPPATTDQALGASSRLRWRRDQNLLATSREKWGEKCHKAEKERKSENRVRLRERFERGKGETSKKSARKEEVKSKASRGSVVKNQKGKRKEMSPNPTIQTMPFCALRGWVKLVVDWTILGLNSAQHFSSHSTQHYRPKTQVLNSKFLWRPQSYPF